MKGKISMVEIAEMSGVSIATVSRVLNHNGRFSLETERKVMNIVNKYGYKVNLNAKGLRTNKTQSIGVIVPDITNEFFAKIIRSIETSLLQKGYTVFVCDSNEDSSTEDKHISSLAAKDVDGIIYISTKSDVKQIYKDYKIPVVHIDRRPEHAGTLIISDNEMGGFLATEALIKDGCKDILMLSDKNYYSTTRNRYKGYVDAHKKYSLPLNEGNVIKTDVSYASSYDAIKKVIADGKKFDGIFCNNDMMALGALQALKDSGISVPEKCKIVGFDDITLSEICDPPITTIQQDTDMFGKKSVETLLNLIENNETKNKNDIYVIPVKLVKRTTA